MLTLVLCRSPHFMALKYKGVIDTPLSKPLLSYKAGMATQHGQHQLMNYLNAWVIARKADGWLANKDKYWFKSLDWQMQ